MVLVLWTEIWLCLQDGKATSPHIDRRAMEKARAVLPCAQGAQGQAWASVARQPRGPGGHRLGLEVRREVARPATAISKWRDLLAASSTVGGDGRLARRLGGTARHARRTGEDQPQGDVHGRDLQGRKKGGTGIGLTKRGKGTKVEVIVSQEGVPLAAVSAPACVGETKLVEPTLEQLNDTSRGSPTFWPEIIVADRAYDSDPLRTVLASVGITLLAPHRCNRKPETMSNDGRRMKRYRNRWRVERAFAHAGNFRRFVTRYERLLVTANAVVNAVFMLMTLGRL